MGYQQDILFPAQAADLSLRFHHIEPRLHIPDLVASWSMDEGSGYMFEDASGLGHTAYITGHNWNTTASGLTSSFRKEGKRGGAVFLDGTQWLQVKDTSSLNSSPITISLWVRPSKAIDKKTILLSRKSTHNGYALCLTQKGNVALEWDDENEKVVMLESSVLIVPHQWTYITVTLDGEKGEAALHINGKAIAKRNGISLSGAAIEGDLFVGGSGTLSVASFNGNIDEVSIYKKALLPAALSDLYINGHPKIYRQFRATIDDPKTSWTAYHGNEPIPHPNEKDTKLLLRFNGNLATAEGINPINSIKASNIFQPGFFGAACHVGSVGPLVYPLHLSSPEGSFEAWYIANPSSLKQTLFRLNGKKGISFQLDKEKGRWTATIKNGNQEFKIFAEDNNIATGTLAHIAVTWKVNKLTLFVNGALKKEMDVAVPLFNSTIEIGGSGNERFRGLLDDVRLSGAAKSWGEVCPSGFLETESAPLDFMDDFGNEKQAAFYWKVYPNNGLWLAQQDKLEKDNWVLKPTAQKGFQAITHPFANGFSSSIESGIVFSDLHDGEAGLFINSDPIADLFSGVRFSISAKKNELQLAVYNSGKLISHKKLPYPFPVKKDKRYTLTLSVYEDVARGFVDGNNLIALQLTNKLARGYAGLFTENSTASFDDVHFSALTPATDSSRLLQVRIISDKFKEDESVSFKSNSFNALRWKKRYGLLPWQRSYKNPEPPGNIFGPNDVDRPNATQSWRSEDAANSDIITIDGVMYYCLRGNPDVNGPHGSSTLGILLTEQHKYDGIHFTDLTNDSTQEKKTSLLQGHEDKGGVCTDALPRDKRLQVNDEGMVYVDGKILVIAREFRNRQQGYPPFRRLVFGLFGVATRKWISNEPFTVSWSAMNPDSCFARFKGINATPEICTLMDTETDKPVILLFHNEARNSMATGLFFDGKDLNLHPRYPARKLFHKKDRDASYGQRVLFDNGIYYMHVNAGSDSTKLRKDWPDRFQLFTALDPYQNTWTESVENSNRAHPYFTRGEENDPDNAAIWQGTMFKYRNRYYMYYENYHSINNRDNAYDLYDEAHSGSRVGFATAN